MTHYTQAHWGTYRVEQGSDGSPVLRHWEKDPDPCDIGLHMLAPELDRVRVRRPSVRRSWLERGPGSAPELRGREPFVEVDWNTALDLVAGELARVKAAHGNEAIFGGSYGWASAGRFHHANSQVHRFLNTIGGYVRHNDSYSLGAGRVLLPHVLMPIDESWNQLTSWDVMAAHTKLFVAFGGVPLKNAQISQGGVGFHQHRPGLAAMAKAGVRFVNISPVNDNLETGGEVEWIPIRPNTDTALMMALAHQWVIDGTVDRDFLARCCSGYESFEPYLMGAADGQPKTAEWASAITGVPAARIVSLAREMHGTRTMINTAWSLQRASHGEQPFWMTIVLGCMLGQVGLPGGGFALGYGPTNRMGSPQTRLPGPSLPQGTNKVRAFIPVARIADMLLSPGAEFRYNGGVHAYPDIKLIYWAGGNPFHHHQDLQRLAKAWQKPETIIVNEPFWTSTAKFADVVLPVTTTLERNDIGFGSHEGVVVAMRKVVPPAGEARDDYAIFTGLAERMGVKEAFTEGRDEMQWVENLYEVLRRRADGMGIAVPEFATFWEEGLINLQSHAKPIVMLEAYRKDPAANMLNTESGKIEIFSERIAGFNLPDCPGHPTWFEPLEWLGAAEAQEWPLHMLSDQPARKLHSQLDASPHSAAGKVAGREPIYLNPQDAAARGIADGDVVEVFNARGRSLAGAVVTADIMAGVVRLATGAWYDHDWQTGIEKHGNPNALTRDIGASGLSQGCTAQSCLVEVRKADGPLPPVTAHALPEFSAMR
ncbi:MAG: molybdopterin guanine dinucleotide-containing S/N-oxide reductase [Alphaproteobacteria bacterium]|nr:molybdopterin guanine dinucleotide-containing S/N-oxide reductase [Alphaproteobacteria bacterium]